MTTTPPSEHDFFLVREHAGTHHNVAPLKKHKHFCLTSLWRKKVNTYVCVQQFCVLDFEVCNGGVTRNWSSKWHHRPGTDFLDTPIWRTYGKDEPSAVACALLPKTNAFSAQVRCNQNPPIRGCPKYWLPRKKHRSINIVVAFRLQWCVWYLEHTCHSYLTERFSVCRRISVQPLV